MQQHLDMAPSSPAATAPPLVNTTAQPDTDDSSEQMYTALVFYLVVLPALWIAPPAIDYLRRRRRGVEPVTALLVDATVNQLEAAEQARRRLHMRVNRTLWQLGWMVVHTASIPYYVRSLVRVGVPITNIEPIVGSFTLHLAFCYPAWQLLLLSVQPIENARIDKVIRSNVIICVLFLLLVNTGIRTFLNGGLIAYAIIIGICGNLGMLTVVISSVHSLHGHKFFGGDPLPSRRKLQRLWLALRLCFLLIGSCLFTSGILRFMCIGSECATSPSAMAISGASALFCALAATPAVRGRFTRWLGSLGKSGPAEQQAASVASLLGDTSVAKALATAAAHFRAQPLSKLTLAALMNNEPDPSLYALTVPAVLGEVDAFMSHSWSDDGKLKYERLHEWARELGGDREAQIWLDKVSAPYKPTQLSLVSSLPNISCPSAGLHRSTPHRRELDVPARLPLRMQAAAHDGWRHIHVATLVRHGGLHLHAHQRCHQHRRALEPAHDQAAR